jgi:hypothetical protein
VYKCSSLTVLSDMSGLTSLKELQLNGCSSLTVLRAGGVEAHLAGEAGAELVAKACPEFQTE